MPLLAEAAAPHRASLRLRARLERRLPELAGDVSARRALGRLRHEVDRAADRVGVLIGGERLRDFDRAEDVGRNVVELRDAAAGLRARNVDAVDGDVRQARLGAANLHELAFAFVALRRDAGNSRRGFGGVGVRQRANDVAGQDRDEVVGVLLLGERLFDRLVEARRRADDDAVELARRSRQYDVVCHGFAGANRDGERIGRKSGAADDRRV